MSTCTVCMFLEKLLQYKILIFIDILTYHYFLKSCMHTVIKILFQCFFLQTRFFMYAYMLTVSNKN